MSGGECAGASSGGESQRLNPTPFLSKTYYLVDDKAFDDLISWNDDGTAFIVWKPAEFARDLLPKYFKHNNFSSFVRQLNTYGFRKLVPDRWEFANDGFRRDGKALLRDIQRRRISGAAAVTVAVSPPAAFRVSPSNSGDEQVLSSNSSPATTTATPPPPPRASATAPEILEENSRLRRENSQISAELNRLRNLCGSIFNLMSSYAANQSEPEPTPPEVPAATDADAAEECPRIFGVSLGAKRQKRCETEEEGGATRARVHDVINSEPLDRQCRDHNPP